MHPIFDCDFVLVIPYVEQEGTGAAGRSIRDASAPVLAHAAEHEGHVARVVYDVVDRVAAVRPALVENLAALQLQVAPDRLLGPLLRLHFATS